jgi:hypothetical protein
VQGKANPIRNRYHAVAVQTVETAAGGRSMRVTPTHNVTLPFTRNGGERPRLAVSYTVPVPVSTVGKGRGGS